MSKPFPQTGDVWTRDGYPGESLTVTMAYAGRLTYERHDGRRGRMNEATLRDKYTLSMRDGKPVEQPS